MPPAALPGLRPAAALISRPQGHPCPLQPWRASARRPRLPAAVFVRVLARGGRSDESGRDAPSRWTARGGPCHGAGVAGRAQAGCRSEASIERAEGRMPEASVRRHWHGRPRACVTHERPATRTARGCPCHGAGLAGERRQDAEAKPAWSDRKAGCLKGASGEMAWVAPSLRHPRASGARDERLAWRDSARGVAAPRVGWQRAANCAGIPVSFRQAGIPP
jgi:hypothetical protein